MITIAGVAVDALRYRALDDDPERLAQDLYGAAWDDTLRYQDTRNEWTQRRLPKPVDAVDVIGPVLRGLIFHDGRSTRDGRGTGWWAPAGDSWIEADLAVVGRELTRTLDGLLAEARMLRNAEGELPKPEAPDWTLGPADPARRRYATYRSRQRDAALRYRLLDVLRAFVAGSSTTLGGMAEHLRTDPGFMLPDGARDVIFRHALDQAVLDYAPGELVPTRELFEAFRGDYGFELTRQDFTACAGRAAKAGVLGPRQRTHAGYAYRMPYDLDEDD